MLCSASQACMCLTQLGDESELRQVEEAAPGHPPAGMCRERSARCGDGERNFCLCLIRSRFLPKLYIWRNMDAVSFFPPTLIWTEWEKPSTQGSSRHGRGQRNKLCPLRRCRLASLPCHRQPMSDYWQRHALSLKLHKSRVPLFCPWWFSGGCFFPSVVMFLPWCQEREKKKTRMWNSQICRSAPSKCRCIDFNHRSSPLGCLCMPYPKQHSQDQGLVGALLPLESFPAPLGRPEDDRSGGWRPAWWNQSQVCHGRDDWEGQLVKRVNGCGGLKREDLARWGALQRPPRENRVWNQCAVKCSLAAGDELQHYLCTSEPPPALSAAHALWGHPHQALLRQFPLTSALSASTPHASPNCYGLANVRLISHHCLTLADLWALHQNPPPPPPPLHPPPLLINQVQLKTLESK